jgi:hypothetical protein
MAGYGKKDPNSTPKAVLFLNAERPYYESSRKNPKQG